MYCNVFVFFVVGGEVWFVSLAAQPWLFSNRLPFYLSISTLKECWLCLLFPWKFVMYGFRIINFQPISIGWDKVYKIERKAKFWPVLVLSDTWLSWNVGTGCKCSGIAVDISVQNVQTVSSVTHSVGTAFLDVLANEVLANVASV